MGVTLLLTSVIDWPTIQPAGGTMDEPKKDPAKRKDSGIGATEDQVDLKDTVPQRIDRHGNKVEDMAGTGQHDSAGG
jgi:hypothetical protein